MKIEKDPPENAFKLLLVNYFLHYFLMKLGALF